jgi:hypothetical protein
MVIILFIDGVLWIRFSLMRAANPVRDSDEPSTDIHLLFARFEITSTLGKKGNRVAAE